MSRVPLLKQLRDQSEAQKAKKNFFEAGLPLSQGLDTWAPLI